MKNWGVVLAIMLAVIFVATASAATDLASIGGTKFNDLNSNGIQDTGEPGLHGWIITLVGPVRDSLETDSLGGYHFYNLPDGTYTVCEVQQSGWVQTSPTSGPLCAGGTKGYTVVISNGQSVFHRDFGNKEVPLNSISGMKFNDLDGDGIKDANEPGLQGWTITLTGAASSAANTNSVGNYKFEGLPDGTYTVCEDQKNNWTQTYPSTGPKCVGKTGMITKGYTLILSKGTNAANKNFGNLKDFCGDGIKSGTEECDDGNQNNNDTCTNKCKLTFCGDNIVQKPNGQNQTESCELPSTQNNAYCNQTTTACSGKKQGTRDAFGACTNVCGCSEDPFVFRCTEGACGAVCDNPNDTNITGTTCKFGCDATNSCGFTQQCSLASFCTNDTYNYQGTCSANGCSFQKFDCNSKDYYENFTTYCSGSEIRQHRLFHDFSCGLNGCNETVKFVNDTAIENCNAKDGSKKNQCGIEDWSCVMPAGGTAACRIVNTTKDDSFCDDNFCQGDTRNFDGFCNDQFYCEYQKENCIGDGSYCAGNGTQARDYFCSPNECKFNVTQTTACQSDGWYNFGNVPGNNDPTCENRDYFCRDNGLNDTCTFNITESHDYDNLDGNYCADAESISSRDYFCNSTGQAEFVQSAKTDCGTEFWSGGGDTPGFGNDPACTYKDFFCKSNGNNSVCGSNITYTQDFDNQDSSDVCMDTKLTSVDYWCKLSTCDNTTPSNGCQPGTTLSSEVCAEVCGAACDNPSDFTVNGTTCNFGCNTNSCNYGQQCSLSSFCTNDTYNYQGTCSANGCSFIQENCNSKDYYENLTTYCSGDEIRQHRVFHDFSCGVNGCNETIIFVNDTSVENCNAKDNSTLNQCGLQDWSCSLVNTIPTCTVVNTTKTTCQGNFCNGDERNYNGLCNDQFYCEYQKENCIGDGSYCAGNGTEARDYFCSPDMCKYNVTQTTACQADGWYNFGNVPGNDDPTCENRDYFCRDNGLNDTCVFNITQTNDYDNLDGNYCANSETIEIRDYFCNSTGQAEFASSSQQDCGNETWSGGGDTPGIGDDPACSYTDYFCASNNNNSSCSSNVTITQDFDNQDTTNVCIGTTLGSSDYWCNLGTCDSQTPQNGCQPGITNTTIACSETCGAACDNTNDFNVTGNTCYFGCDTDSCNFGSSCSLSSFCTNDTYNYQGACSATGCSFIQENCNSKDYYENITTYCSGSEIRQQRLFHDFSCGVNGCSETIKIINDTLVENCNDKDGSKFKQCGLEDWSCSLVNNTPACTVVNITKNDTPCQNTMFCSGDTRNFNGTCANNFFCQWQTESCNQDGSYCAGDGTETRDYFCSPGACIYNVTQSTTCPSDGWYNFGNVPGFDDPACENRDYFCADNGLNDTCTYNITESKDFDYLDSSTCQGDSIADVDFFCTSQGKPNYTLSINSCGTDFYEYACPFGTSPGDDTGRRFHNATCENNACTEKIGDWEVDEVCTDKEACFWDGLGNDDQNYFCKEITNCTDADHDGYNATSNSCPTGNDCNDANPNIHPGATEICNYLDDNCNNLTDEGFDVGSVCIEGTGACQDTGIKICLANGTGTVCNAVPGQPTNETCNNIDDNCNGQIDEGNICPSNKPPEIHVDLTPDNPKDSDDLICYGTAFDPENDTLTVTYKFIGDYNASGTAAKVDGFWTATVPAANTAIGSRITCIMTATDGFSNDTDFDSVIVGNGTNPCVDNDHDAHFAVSQACPAGDDCNDNNPGVHPGATEVCNYADDNCNNHTDENFDVGVLCTTGTGACQTTGVKICAANGLGTTCDATPGQPKNETCNNIDDNCNGQVDENNICNLNRPPEIHVDLTPDNPTDSDNLICIGTTSDLDNDTLTVTYAFTNGYSASGTATQISTNVWRADVPDSETSIGEIITCTMTVTDSKSNSTDFDSVIIGNATQNCTDADHDGYNATSQFCSNGNDCNDSNPAIHPGAAEVCNYIDDNCNGQIDENFDVGQSCKAGLGVCEAVGIKVCLNNGTGTMCNAVPGTPAEEICNDQLDNNCNGLIDNQDPVCETSACIPFTLVNTFKNGSSFNDAVFRSPGKDMSVQMNVPTGRLILSALVDISGLPLSASESGNLDLVIVTDNSATMSEGCAEENMTCKIDYAKNADKQLVDEVLKSPASKVGLVAFKTEVTSSLELTSNKTALLNQIDTYAASSTTCISCGLSKGTEIAMPNTKKKVMILISDGEANQCQSGRCTTTTAKNEAVARAADAKAAGITVHTIIVTDTQMDPATMQRIADAGGGKYYTASSANLTQVLREMFANEIVSNPRNVQSDIGNDGDVQFFFNDTFTGRQTINFTQELKELLAGCTPVNGVCTINTSTMSDAVGIVQYDRLNVTACAFAVNPVCTKDVDCGQNEVGEWSSYVCDWENVCDTDATCTRQRSAANNICNNPGLDVSFCSTEEFNEKESVESQRLPDPSCTTHVLLSEVFYDAPGADSDEEWIELFNPTNSVIDLSTYSIQDGSSTYNIPQGTMITAGGKLVIARNASGFSALYGFSPDISGFTLSLNNNGDHLKLRNGNVEIDMTAWEGGFGNAFPSWLLNATTNSSIKRKSGVDTDTPADWIAGTPTPGVVFVLPAPPVNLKAVVSGSNIVLIWNASANAQYYKIYSSSYVGGPYEYAANTTNTTWTDTAAAEAKKKYYMVRSVMDGAEETNTNKVGKFDYMLIKKSGSTGKNWVSLPLATSITKASELATALGTNIDTITRWNPQLQQTEGWINVWGGVGTDFAIKRGEFYEVHVKEATNWTLTGSVPTSEDNIDLKFVSGSGRNWIGLMVNTALERASQLAESIGSAVTMVRRWDPTSQTYNAFTPSAGANFTVRSGEGYEVHVSANTTWTPV
ncbi:MAG: lamin tail domain-containing protein [Candidatus Aenigmarchaeota archaeon]|nr:lamin tail domain-containing protein [Candidatus Aenigmarchaeota archaeon]